MTRKEVLSAIEEAEREGAFDRHVDPIPEEIVIPVTESYHYPNNRTLLERIKFRLHFDRVWLYNNGAIDNCVIDWRGTRLGKQRPFAG